MKYQMLGIFLLAIPLIGLSQSEKRPPNVLFIAVDDLRPELGAYGANYAYTPNMDRFANEGRLFQRHYVQVPTCGASRRALLSGELPSKKIHLNNQAMVKEYMGKEEPEHPETFAHHFKRNGYTTISMGKISHYVDGKVYTYEQEGDGAFELPHSWDKRWGVVDEWKTAWNGFFGYQGGKNRTDEKSQVFPFEVGKGGDRLYPDGRLADKAVAELKKLRTSDKPFLLAVGFYKPHLPFTAPEKYWRYYHQNSLPLAPFGEIPMNVHKASLHQSGELNRYQRGLEKASLDDPLSADYARLLRHAYLACISYVDAQIGKLLNELERSGLAENTIVVIWGDHGWHLGDHRVWGKHTLFERSLRSVLMIKTPNMKKRGRASNAIVSTVDLYPTLVELCDLPELPGLDGRSLVPYLKNPFKNPSNQAYAYWRNGMSMRNNRYRITQFYREDQPVVELYDHLKDPNETINIAERKAGKVKKLKVLLEKEMHAIYP